MANRFWVGGSGTWDAATTTHWAATSNGAGGASVPGASDSVTFDTNSGSPVVTLATNPSVINVSLVSGTTMTLTMGSTAFTLSGFWDMWDPSGLTVTANTATITFTGAASSFNCSNKNMNGLSLVWTASTSGNIQGGSATLANITITGAANPNGVWELYVNSVVTGTFTVTGNSTVNRVIVRSTAPGTPRTITAGAVSLTNVDFKDITGAGAAAWHGTSVGNLGGNSNIAFSYPLVAGASAAGSLNRLAGTTGLDAQGAANRWAGTVGKDLVGALNTKAGGTRLEYNGVCRLLASQLGGNAELDAQGALASIP